MRLFKRSQTCNALTTPSRLILLLLRHQKAFFFLLSSFFSVWLSGFPHPVWDIERHLPAWSFRDGGRYPVWSPTEDWGKGFGVKRWGGIILSFWGHSANFWKPHPQARLCVCVCVLECEHVCVLAWVRKRGPWPLRALCEETTAVHSQQLIGPYLAVPFIFIFYQLLSIICVLSWVWDLILFG